MKVLVSLVVLFAAMGAVMTADHFTGHALLAWLKEMAKENPDSWPAMLIAAAFLFGLVWLFERRIAEIVREFHRQNAAPEADPKPEKTDKTKPEKA